MFLRATALADLLGGDERLADSHALYPCHDRLLAHKEALFTHLVECWRDLFDASFDVLLYDLTSTYFGAQGKAWCFQRVQFPHRQGVRECPSACINIVIEIPIGAQGPG
jgi:hypothetical protein